MRINKSAGEDWTRHDPYIHLLLYVLFIGSMLVATGCSEKYFERQDMKTVRRQFHLPATARFISLDSSPKKPGWFGREGLVIRATLEFQAESFEEYLADLDDSGIWQPVRFRHYSPGLADEHTEDAFRWNDLPLPELLLERFRQAGFEPKGMDLQQGRYYCSVVVTARGEPLESNPAAYHWRNLSQAYAEMSESESPTIMTFAVLDFEQRLLYVHIRFSG
ncbi:hypothetical protein ACFL6R_05340 [Gemmatimonadota bacterium]